MAKSRLITFFLLKENFSATNALKDTNDLQLIDLSNLSDGTLYLADLPPKTPWWISYLGISQDVLQVFKGAILFLAVEGRTFALTFGNIQYKLKPESYEYDFGLITTLNSINPKELKSTDILQPENAIRRRIQTPKLSELTFFDFDRDSSIIKRLTGKVRDDYKHLFTNTSGADSVRISTKKQLSDLTDLCKQLLEIYKKDDYKAAFPGLHNIRPIKDPSKLVFLDQELIKQLQNQSKEIMLAIPDIVDYPNISRIKFSPSKCANEYESLEIVSFYSYLGNDVSNLNVSDLKYKYHFWGIDENNDQVTDTFSVYKSFIYDFSDTTGCYHFCDGKWYQVESTLIATLKNELDPIFGINTLPDYTKESEGEYNQFIPTIQNDYICLDTKSIAPTGESAVEPCDLFKAVGNVAYFTHVKIGNRSSALSHLFNQGVNSIFLINTVPESKNKLKCLIDSHPKKENYKAAIDSKESKVIFAIISKKDASLKSEILPLFSRISLKNAIQTLKSMNVQYEVVIIKDARK